MKTFYTLSILFLLVTAGGMLAGCSSKPQSDNITGNTAKGTAAELTIAIDKLEIFHFHGNSQCYSCVTMGDYAEATVNTYFQDEVEQGIIVFEHINGELSENRELVIKYGATGSSLWLGTYSGDDFTPEQNIQVWYKLTNKQDYMDYLKGVIEQKLAGN
jgi:hypothetical protein